jgi:hypothetical protein
MGHLRQRSTPGNKKEEVKQKVNQNCCGRNSNYGICAKCLHLRELTKHHVLPRRTFNSGRDSPILHVCRSCHDIIDAMTEGREHLGREYLIEMTQDWLRGFFVQENREAA